MTEARQDRYPGYDVMAKRDTPSWNPVTREVIDRRLAVPREPRFFNPDEWAALQAVCDRIVPQPSNRAKVPLPAYVDEKMFTRKLDGYRYEGVPEQSQAWKQGLAALDEAANREHGAGFAAIRPEQQDGLLRQMEAGTLQAEALQGMWPDGFFKHRVIQDIVGAYYAHPTGWNEIGFGGPASPRGYVRTDLNRRDPWEAAEAKPGQEEKARRENKRVG